MIAPNKGIHGYDFHTLNFTLNLGLSRKRYDVAFQQKHSANVLQYNSEDARDVEMEIQWVGGLTDICNYCMRYGAVT